MHLRCCPAHWASPCPADHHNMFSGVTAYLRPYLKAADAKCGSLGYSGVDVKQSVAVDAVGDRFAAQAPFVDVPSASRVSFLADVNS